ncbi:FecR family protein [Chitinophaga rupis]|uniref:FecR family protein n=1 Tax=Chitinophaga rupis TaxID=573321 RepID=A0A1H7XY61_9BACT|nr:FecR domain-containing protein [Chitinophaga rupis]SEM38862.1 FecR family protein [Chitinophaga rupis]
MSETDMSLYPDPDLLLQRMVEKITGTISERDNYVLEELIEKNEDVKNAWTAFSSSFSQEDRDTQMARLGTDVFWKGSALNRNVIAQNKVYIIKRWLWAAVFTGILAGSYLLYTQLRGVKRNLFLTGNPTQATNSIQLQLAEGQTIDLSATQGTVQAGNTTLVNQQKSLHFTDAGTGDGVGGLNTLKVPVGQDYNIVLADGTKVQMNSATEMRFPFRFNGATRDIYINGEAYLEVARDAKHPLIVHSAGSAVQVLGTSFNINTYEADQLTVSLVNGSVKVKNRGKETIIRPGEQAVVQQTAGNIQVLAFDREEVLSWREGIRIFDNATVQEISSVLPRWYGVQIQIDNPSLADRRFSGVLDRKMPIQDFLNALKATIALDYYEDKKGVLHLK